MQVHWVHHKQGKREYWDLVINGVDCAMVFPPGQVKAERFVCRCLKDTDHGTLQEAQAYAVKICSARPEFRDRTPGDGHGTQ